MSQFAPDHEPTTEEQTTQQSVETTQPTTAPSQSSVYEQLVGDGKKYRDQEALAKSRLDAEAHIARLEKENQEAREAYLKLVEEQEARQQEIDQRIEQIAQRTKEAATSKGLDPSAVDEVVEAKLKSLKEQEIITARVKQGDEAMLSYYDGDANKVKEHLRAKSEELGVSVDYILDQAKTSPQAMLKLLGMDSPRTKVESQQQAGSVVPRQAELTAQQGGDLRTYADFQALKKANPNKFNSAKVQTLLFEKVKEARLQGKNFYQS